MKKQKRKYLLLNREMNHYYLSEYSAQHEPLDLFLEICINTTIITFLFCFFFFV